MLLKLGLWRDANSDKLLVTPTSSPSHKNGNDSRGNSPKKNENVSSDTETTALESQQGQMMESGVDVSVSIKS